MKRATPPLIKEFNIQLRRQTYRITVPAENIVEDIVGVE